MFSFRLRILRSPRDALGCNQPTWPIELPNCPSSITLLAPNDSQTIQEATTFILRGDGFSTEEAASTFGNQLKSALAIALAAVRVGANFGDRTHGGIVTSHGLRWLEEQQRQRMLNDVHGLMMYETDPPPRFAAVNASLLRITQMEPFERTLRDAYNSRAALNQQDWLALSLFNSSFFQSSSDSRFVLLIMAIEALLEPQMRSSVAVTHVDQLISTTQNNLSLTEDERNSLIGSLRWLRRESINQTGKKLAASRLADRTYRGVSPEDFFALCYRHRSNLVHGNVPIPDYQTIGSLSGELERFVSDLIVAPYVSLL